VPNRAAIRTGNDALGVRNTTKVTLRVLNLARVRCPVRTGNLRNSHQMRVEVNSARNHVVGHVFTHVKYARPVHQGRKARTIRPKTKKALRFYWRGKWWVRAVVHQGPVRGQPWLRKALREVAASEGYKISRSPKYNYPAGRL
jgi:hypothetical protein